MEDCDGSRRRYLPLQKGLRNPSPKFVQRRKISMHFLVSASSLGHKQMNQKQINVSGGSCLARLLSAYIAEKIGLLR